MAYAAPDNALGTEVLTSTEMNLRANNQIFFASLLANAVPLSSLNNGDELHYDMNFTYVTDSTERSYAISSSSAWEVHSTATKLIITAASERPIFIVCDALFKTSTDTLLVRIQKYNGSGGQDRTHQRNYANTAYDAQGAPIFYLLEAPTKGTQYTFAINVRCNGATPTAYMDNATWFAIAL